MKCSKVPYASRREAIAAGKLHGEISRGSVYKCYCGYWHHGHKIPKKSNAGKVARIGQLRRRTLKRILWLIDQICGVN